ncbi:MAG: DRTGG domain-containing protein [Bacillota bacterium]
MNLAEIQKILEAKVIWGEDLEKREVLTGFGCDLMSDCLAYAKPKGLMLTGLCNSQVIRTAEILDVQGIVFVRGKQPDQEMVDMARQKGIPLLSTNKLMFDSCGLLFVAGLQGG